MILADTSAWIEYLRDTGTRSHLLLRDLIEREQPHFTTDTVLMEVLAGARDERALVAFRALLARCELLSTESPGDYERAAEIFRACRRGGATIRSLSDCLIGAVALRAGAAVLHADRDFDAIARFAPLEIA